ncbi:MAG: hypothetical protein PHX25_02595 [Candidatus Pacebacteria bacterium]|nr:hypothetical protein [Candidatus Paceibacterota bacterium]
MENFLFNWQTLIGSLIGVTTPFLLWWFVEQRKKKDINKKFLYYLEKVIVGQINLLCDIEITLNRFLDFKVKELIDNIDDTPIEVYSADTAFFPLFSTRALPYDVIKESSGSGYIDNKLAKIFSLSEDFPHIINDLRHQFEDTLNKNEKMAFNKLNSPKVQKEQFKTNIQKYEEVFREDMLDKNIPIYFKKLAETLVAVRKKAKMRPVFWKMKFDPRWRWYPYQNKKNYLKARSEVIDKMDVYFENDTRILLESIGKNVYKEKVILSDKKS